MKKIFNLVLFLFITSTFTFSTILAQDKPSFVGVKKCGMCHKKDKDGNQLKIWEESKHANAFKTLQNEASKKIAAEKGIADASKAAECLVCHAIGYTEGALVDKKFKVEDGVQCEMCHGAGSEYKSKKTMQDHAASVAAGLTEYKDLAAIKAQCVTCHNDKSPTFKGFNFEERWAEIQHPIPKKIR